MTGFGHTITERLRQINLRYLPFADAATADLPLGRLVRLALFQISVGMASVLLLGTLNRVMIVELSVPAGLVAVMVALPFFFAPLRALIGFRSDVHQSAFGWRRVPYIWIGTMLQFGGLSIMPFALLVLSGDGAGPVVFGQIGAALAFLLVGAGMHMTQTVGLALATDLAKPESRPRVVALMYVMLLLGMIFSGFIFASLLSDFTALRLIQVVQGAALATLFFNVIALWKQEARRSAPPIAENAPVNFKQAWQVFMTNPKAFRFLLAVGLGTAAFNMQDIILEPYGAEVLHLSVGQTTLLTTILALGSLLAFGVAGKALSLDFDPCRLAAAGVLCGLVGFPFVILSGALEQPLLFRLGVLLIGFGGGLFAVSTLIIAMNLNIENYNGLALGAWGAVQATSAGLSIATGGLLRDGIASLGQTGALGSFFKSPYVSYNFVYCFEVALLFGTLVALGPLVRRLSTYVLPIPSHPTRSRAIGLAELPG
jgi:MFS transporter, BCD family, chlorophyll transporter